MAASLPPELVAPEDREVRAVELERQVAREWVRFAIADNVLIAVGIGVGLLYAWADAISWNAFVVILILLGHGVAALVLYWVSRRIQPLQKEIATLRAARW